MPKSIDDKKVFKGCRLGKKDIDFLQKLADKQFETNFSMALRLAAELGIKQLMAKQKSGPGVS